MKIKKLLSTASKIRAIVLGGLFAVVFTVLCTEAKAQTSQTITIETQGTYSQWCFGAGASKPVAMQSDDANTSYIFQDGISQVCAVGAGAKESYNLTNTTGTTAIDSVVVQIKAAKVGAGTQVIKIGVRSGTTESFGADITLTTTYTLYRRVFTTDPQDASAWTCADVDGTQWLLESVTVSDGAGREQRATLGNVIVYYSATGVCNPAAGGQNRRRTVILKSGG